MIKRQLGDRRPGFPMEFPLIDRDEVFVSRDRHILPPSEREAYRAEHHEAMKKRAESMGLSLLIISRITAQDLAVVVQATGMVAEVQVTGVRVMPAGTIVAATRLIMTIVALLLGRS